MFLFYNVIYLLQDFSLLIWKQISYVDLSKGKINKYSTRIIFIILNNEINYKYLFFYLIVENIDILFKDLMDVIMKNIQLLMF